MSWNEAKTKAETIYKELSAHHSHGFIGMVIDALKRHHTRNKPKQPKPPLEKEIKQ